MVGLSPKDEVSPKGRFLWAQAKAESLMFGLQFPRGKVESAAPPLPLPGFQEDPAVKAEALVVASPEANNRPGNGVRMLPIGAFLISITY